MQGLSIKNRMTIVVSVLTAVMLSVLAFSFHLFYSEQLKQLVCDQQYTLLTAITDEVDQKLEEGRTEVLAAAQTLTPEDVADPARVQRFLSRRPHLSEQFDNGFFLFSPGGKLIYGTEVEPRLLSRDFSQHGYLKETLARRTPQISTPFFSIQSHGHPIVMFTAPILGRHGTVVGVLAGSMDLLKLNFLGKLASMKIGTGGYLYVVDRHGTLLIHPDRTRILTQVPTGTNYLLDRACAGFEGSGETVTTGKLSSISSFKRLKSTGWILAINFPRSEAYRPLYRTEKFVLFTLAIIFAMAMTVIALFMKYLTAPLLSFTGQIQELIDRKSARTRVSVEAHNEIGTLGASFNRLLDELDERKAELQKQLEFLQMLIDTIPMPIFYKDTAGLYLGCNTAFEAWTGYSRQQMIGKTVFDIAPPDLAAVYHEADLSVMRKRQHQVYEAQAVNAAGLTRDVVFSKASFPTTDGKVGGLIGTLLDITDRKQAEAELEVQKEFAENLVQNSAVPTFVVNSSHQVILWNRGCEVLTGVKATEVVGVRELWSIFFSEKRPVLADILIDNDLRDVDRYYQRVAFSSMIPGGIQAEGEFHDQQGRLHYLSINAAPIRDRQGKIVAVIETMEDITPRKIAEDALEKSSRRLQLILDAAGEGVYGVDLEGKVTFLNPAGAKMIGWTQEELLGRDPHDILHHAQGDGTPVPADKCPLQSAFRDGKSIRIEDDLFWRKNGTSFPVEYICTPLVEAGKRVGAVVLFKDNSERKLAEEQLLKLSQAIRQSPVAIVITDLKGNIEFVNPMFTEITGYAPFEALGANPRLLKADNVAPEVYEDLWRTISTGGVWSGELHNRRKDGTSTWVHSTISSIRNSAGEISHYMSFMESMEERKKLEEQLRQAQKMEAIGQLAGGIAHDFNNILTVIMGFGQMLRTTISDEDRRRSDIDQILGAADRAAQLTKSLLAFSRKQVMALQQVELNDLTQMLLKFLHRIIGEDVALRTSLSEKPLMVLADRGQIEQVLMNLATNARDAMPSGGELFIGTDLVRLDKEFHQQHGYGLPGEYALMTISDTGSGMSPEVAEKIFEPFFTTKAPGRGTGLGLAIVYGIVKQHGGYITIDSQLGHGTTFRIYIPMAQERMESEVLPEVAVPTGGSETILVVEDDPSVRLLAESVLTTFGYKVLTAENGVEALQVFRDNRDRIALALLDVIMPKMNGKQVCEALRKESPKLKVLFQSGYTADLLQDKGVLVDGVDLIMKPVQPIVLARKIREMLDAG
ncbi:PAS domain S-box protein [Geomesophilobacter sediminis]|uniref:histidine kinase n=1 Tax=Geomesophilobacter sediminis TaxID=2798584 RepID=A0A8J7JAH7_9BACT|nr:PAS domain S-box protein [Geomesophilobacter sediminis]MBJ6723906.1 PAS domain S-box protein [Geomesophilobacter sediminis]